MAPKGLIGTAPIPVLASPVGLDPVSAGHPAPPRWGFPSLQRHQGVQASPPNVHEQNNQPQAPALRDGLCHAEEDVQGAYLPDFPNCLKTVITLNARSGRCKSVISLLT